MKTLNTSQGNKKGGSGRFTSGQSYVERLDDGLGHPRCQVRYRKRCVSSGRCENCGRAMPSGDGRFRCPECLRKQVDRKLRARVLRLWTLGASDEQVARLCIGGTDTPRLPRGWKAAPLAIRCGECREVVDVLRSHQRCACGGDLWQGVPSSVRKRWLRLSEEERAEQAIG